MGNDLTQGTGYLTPLACASWCATVPNCVGFGQNIVPYVDYCWLKFAVIPGGTNMNVNCYVMDTGTVCSS